jgi:hypothetical protein
MTLPSNAEENEGSKTISSENKGLKTKVVKTKVPKELLSKHCYM